MLRSLEMESCYDVQLMGGCEARLIEAFGKRSFARLEQLKVRWWEGQRVQKFERGCCLTRWSLCQNDPRP